MKHTKRLLATLLACLLLLSIAAPIASAEEPPAIDVSGAVPLTLNADTPASNVTNVFSYTPAETGWVKFTTKNVSGSTLTMLDDEQNQFYTGSLQSSVVGNIMKAHAGKTLYFVLDVYTLEEWSGTITLTPAERPVLVQNTLKCWSDQSSGTSHKPFQEDWYVGWSFTVNGQTAPALGFSYLYSGIRTGNAKAGTYSLQFTNYDGEDLGTLTVTIEDMNLRSWLTDILNGLKEQWANEDKTTKEWLKSISSDFWLMIASPIVALMIFFCGPMGWILIPVAFQPFIQLPIDIIGLFKSIFR